MWELMSSYIGTNKQSIQRSIVNHVEYTLARTRFNFDNMGAYQATAYSVRDRLLEAWNDTQQYHTVSNRSSLSYKWRKILPLSVYGNFRILCFVVCLHPSYSLYLIEWDD